MDEVLHFIQRIPVCVVPFGSYCLGAMVPDHSDIDLLVLLPAGVTRVDFFQSFVDVFEDVIVVLDTFVPVVKFKHKSQQYDIIAACTHCTSFLPGWIPQKSACVSDVDIRCFNAAFVTSRILQFVSPLQLDAFKQVLRCLKTKALRMGCYSNPRGLLNGVGLAILLAWICRLYPCAILPEMIEQLFYERMGSFDFSSHAIDLVSHERPPIFQKAMTVYVPSDEPGTSLNAFHNVTHDSFTWIRSFFQGDIIPFWDFHSKFLHIHIFTHKSSLPTRTDHLRFVAQVESKLKTIPGFRCGNYTYESESLKHFRSSIFLGMVGDDVKEELLQAISTFCLGHVRLPDKCIASEILSKEFLPSFVELSL